MTVGELVYLETTKDGYNPEDISPELKKIAAAYQGVFDTMREPMKAMYSMVETMQEPMRQAAKAASSVAAALEPQMETIRRIADYSVLPTLPSFIPSSLYDEDGELFMPEFIHPVQEVRIVNPEDIGISSAKRTSEYVIANYILPQNATWESLDIQFIDGHFVKVSYPTMESKKFDFKDMGFINTKTNKPDLKWQLLREMADNNGVLTNEKWDRKFTRNVKYELKERLMEFFGMKESPIPHYTKKNGYQAKFSLRGDK